MEKIDTNPTKYKIYTRMIQRVRLWIILQYKKIYKLPEINNILLFWSRFQKQNTKVYVGTSTITSYFDMFWEVFNYSFIKSKWSLKYIWTFWYTIVGTR